VLYARTRHDRNRPLLRVADPLAKLKELFLERDPLYRQVADLVVEAREGGAAALALAIEAKLSS
jgi:shikimate kinase